MNRWLVLRYSTHRDAKSLKKENTISLHKGRYVVMIISESGWGMEDMVELIAVLLVTNVT